MIQTELTSLANSSRGRIISRLYLEQLNLDDPEPPPPQPSVPEPPAQEAKKFSRKWTAKKGLSRVVNINQRGREKRSYLKVYSQDLSMGKLEFFLFFLGNMDM